MIDSSKLPKNESEVTRRQLIVSSAPTSKTEAAPTPTATPTGTPTPTATATAPPVTKTYCIVVRRKDTRDPLEKQKTFPISHISDGIVVRAPAPYLVTITEVDTNIERTGEQLLFLPDTQRDYYLPLDRSPFVKNDTQITLVKGVVQKVTVSRPSIILGILGVPKTILDALVPLPH